MSTGRPKSDHLARWLSSISHNHHHNFEGAVLRVYEEVMKALVVAAQHGLRLAVIRPNMDLLGAEAKVIPPTYMARIIAALLEREGVQARVVHRELVSVCWGTYPTHWDSDN